MKRKRNVFFLLAGAIFFALLTATGLSSCRPAGPSEPPDGSGDPSPVPPETEPQLPLGSVTERTASDGSVFKTTARRPEENGVVSEISGQVRVQILGDGIVRAEANTAASFLDAPSLLVPDRTRFTGAPVAYDTDGETIVLQTARFVVNLPARDAKLADLRVCTPDGALLYTSATPKNACYTSLPDPGKTPDCWVLSDTRAILPPETGLTYAGSGAPASGFSRAAGSDLYLFLPLGDPFRLRADWIAVTGPTDLPLVKEFGAWYSKWTKYSAAERLAMIARWRREDVPLDILVVDTEWKDTSKNGNDGNGTGYDVNTDLYPDMAKFLAAANEAGVLVLFNDHTHETSRKLTDPVELKWQTEGVVSLLRLGLNGWWYDKNWTYRIQSPFDDLSFKTLGQIFYHDTIRTYNKENRGGERPLLLSNLDYVNHGEIVSQPSMIGHRYGVQWTGDVFANAISFRTEIGTMVDAGVIGASPYVSSDLGGFHGTDTLTDSHLRRWLEFGAFSPLFRPHGTLSMKNEKLPWSSGAATEKVYRNYLKMRYALLPFYYSLGAENHETGVPLARRLDFYYPQYPEASDNTEYLLGRDLLVAPYWSVSGSGAETVPASWLKTKDGKPGLDAAYYNTSKDLSSAHYFDGKPVKEERVNEIDFFWGKEAPKGVQTDYFAAVYTGTITPDRDCRLGTISDDGARIYIDGKYWSGVWAANDSKAAVNTSKLLKAGETHEIRVEYFELTGRAVLYLVHEPEAARLSSSRTVFFPDWEWVDLFTGETFSGPVTKQIEKPDDAIPLYLRRGGLLLTAEPVSPITCADFERITLTVCGQGESSFVLYEDDGRTEEYLDGAFRKTAFTAHTEDGTTTLTVGAAEGSFASGYTARALTVRVLSETPVSDVKVNGAAVLATRIAKDAAALPVNEKGALPAGDVWQFSFEAPLDRETVITYFSEEKPYFSEEK